MQKSLLEFSATYQLRHLQKILEALNRKVDLPKLKSSSIRDDFKKLEVDPTFSDVSFLLQDCGQMKRVHAHKLILCTKCQYFNAMLNSHMAESSMKEITVQDFSYSQFTQVDLYLTL